jgi:predicted P-loop ATPase
MESPQGKKKSSAFRVLGDPWFSDSLPGDLHSKDAADHVCGNWIIELAELGQIKRTSIETLKAFITRREERFRAAYARYKTIYPRQCVFCGTTNKDAYLPDETGNRRFWPVKVGDIDLRALERDRDQLWAEAVHRYRAGEQWWLTDERLIAVATEQQAERYEADPWEEPIRKYLTGRTEVTVGKVLSETLMIEVSRQRKGEQNRVTAVLEHLGWVRGPRTEKAKPWVPGHRWMQK